MVDSAPTQGVSCLLSNKRGEWQIVTPANVEINRSQSLLSFSCTKPGWKHSTDYYSSVETSSAIAGAVLFGFGELAVDASTGAGNNYPKSITIEMTATGQ